MTRYVALLRGIGPARKAPSAELIQAFEGGGYTEVRPVISTGNVVFSTSGHQKVSPEQLESVLVDHFGYEIPVILRTGHQFARILNSGAFDDVDLDAWTRFVTLLGEGVRLPKPLPAPGSDAGFAIVGSSGGNLFLVRRSEGAGTPEMMAFLDRSFGSRITTRTWNTIEKIGARL